MLVGATVSVTQLREIVQEFGGKFVPAYVLPGKLAFRCFEYDPNTGRYSLDLGSCCSCSLEDSRSWRRCPSSTGLRHALPEDLTSVKREDPAPDRIGDDSAWRTREGRPL